MIDNPSATPRHTPTSVWAELGAPAHLQAVIDRLAPTNRARIPLSIEETRYYTKHFSEELVRQIDADETVWYVEIHIRTNHTDSRPAEAIQGQHDFSVTGTGETRAKALQNAHRNLTRQATLLAHGNGIDPMSFKARDAARGSTH